MKSKTFYLQVRNSEALDVDPSRLAVSVFQRRLLCVSDASGAGPQAAAGRRPGAKHRRHGGLLPHPSGTRLFFLFTGVCSFLSELLVTLRLCAGEPGAAAADQRDGPSEDGGRDEGGGNSLCGQVPFLDRWLPCISSYLYNGFLLSD